jgi:hypothetical protein
MKRKERLHPLFHNNNNNKVVSILEVLRLDIWTFEQDRTAAAAGEEVTIVHGLVGEETECGNGTVFREYRHYELPPTASPVVVSIEKVAFPGGAAVLRHPFPLEETAALLLHRHLHPSEEAGSLLFRVGIHTTAIEKYRWRDHNHPDQEEISEILVDRLRLLGVDLLLVAGETFGTSLLLQLLTATL